jgi:hypothetical protein
MTKNPPTLPKPRSIIRSPLLRLPDQNISPWQVNHLVFEFYWERLICHPCYDHHRRALIGIATWNS